MGAGAGESVGPKESIRASEGGGRASRRGAGESAGPREGEHRHWRVGHAGEIGVAWAAVWEGESMQGRGEHVGEGRARGGRESARGRGAKVHMGEGEGESVHTGGEHACKREGGRCVCTCTQGQGRGWA